MNKYVDDTVKISFEYDMLVLVGDLRYPSLTDYKEIKEYLWAKIPSICLTPTFSINIEKLDQLNSSGQAILNMFLLELKRHSCGITIHVYATKGIEWQTKIVYTFFQLWCNKNDIIYIYMDGEEVKGFNTKKVRNIKDWT